MRVEAEIASKHFASTATTAIEDLRLAVEPGEFVALTGVSGSGKSTLLQILAGLDENYSGDVRLDGTPPRAGRMDVAYVFQSPRLMPWLTARENVALVVDDDDTERLAAGDALLVRMGLRGFEDAYPAQLSGGMQRRVSLARAFVRAPRLLLLDEPFVSLDVDTAARLRELLLELWAISGATVLFVTHDLDEALVLADRLVVFTPPPGRVANSFAIETPRPRNASEPGLAAIRAAIGPLLSYDSRDASPAPSASPLPGAPVAPGHEPAMKP